MGLADVSLYRICRFWWAGALASQATQLTGDSNTREWRDEVPRVLPTPLDILLLIQELLCDCLHVKIRLGCHLGVPRKIGCVLCNCDCDRLLVVDCERTLRPHLLPYSRRPCAG